MRTSRSRSTTMTTRHTGVSAGKLNYLARGMMSKLAACNPHQLRLLTENIVGMKTKRTRDGNSGGTLKKAKHAPARTGPLSVYPESKVRQLDMEKKFMNDATSYVVERMRVFMSPAKSKRLLVAALDTIRFDSCKSIVGPKRVVVCEHNPDASRQMQARKPAFVESIFQCDTGLLHYQLGSRNQLDVDILDFCYSWASAAPIVEKRFTTGMYAKGTVVRLTVATRTSVPGQRYDTWKNAIVGDITTWAGCVGLGVKFLRVCDWGPAYTKWARHIADPNSVVYQYGNTGAPMYNFIFILA